MTNHFIARKGHQPKKPYKYMGCGLDNIYLLSGYDLVADEDDSGVVIHNLDALHQAIAEHLVKEEKVLSGKEIRFLRTYMDLSQSGLGKLLGCDSQTVARYEKEQCENIPAPTDRLLRMMVLGHITQRVDVHGVVRRIEEMEGRTNQKFRFAATKTGWKASA